MVYDFMVRHLSQMPLDISTKRKPKETVLSDEYSEDLICILQLLPCWHAPDKKGVLSIKMIF